MKYLSLLFLAQLAHGAVTPVDADHPLEVGSPVFAGSGCPAKSTSAAVRPNESDVAIVGQLKTSTSKAGGNTGKTSSVQTCNVVIPVEVAKGYQAALTGAKFDGSYELPRGSKAVLHTERFVAGGAGLRHEQELIAPPGGLKGSYENDMAPEEAVWTSCNGGGYNLRANTSILLNNPSRLKLASISIGAAGSKSAEVQYKVQWRRCRQ